MATAPKRERSGLGLRARGTVAFAVLALMLSASLAVLTYEIARSYLLDQRHSLALRQASVNARAAKEVLRAREPDVQVLLAGLPRSNGSHPVLRVADQWFSAALNVGRDTMPKALVSATERRSAARQRAVVNGEPVLVIGIPLAGSDATYFEVFPLTELRRTLSTLGFALLAAATITTVLGAVLGAYASRRVLRPLRNFAGGASQIAQGRLETRVTAPGDKDLAPLATSFNDMAEVLQYRVQRDARFASDVSHELRTPLTALSAAVEVLDRRAEDHLRPAVDVLRTQVRHFEQLVLDLLEISRFDAGAIEFRPEIIDVRSFFASLKQGLEHDDVGLDVEASAPATFALDKRRVERTLANLLENADRYAGGAIRIVVTGSSGRLRIAVEDAGPGIPASEHHAVFERFHRLQAPARDGTRGTGLGLALVAEHAALHGGRAWVEPVTGGGARFVVELTEQRS